MSKESDLRAMREARYAARTAGAGRPATRLAAPKKETPKKDAPVAPPLAKGAGDAGDGLCGHRSMNGRTCTREAGHSAKSHRYS